MNEAINSDKKYCFKCGTKLSIDAAFCSNCGQNLSIDKDNSFSSNNVVLNKSENKKNPKIASIIGIVFVFWVISAFIVSFLPNTTNQRELRNTSNVENSPSNSSNNKESSESQESNNSTSNDNVLQAKANEHCTASYSKDSLERAIQYVVDGDKQAWSTMLATGEIFILDTNKNVFVDGDNGFASGLIKIRYEGDTTEMWTTRECVNY